ncbi:MAG: hypothetical protein LBH25_05355 [Fibromonadaceae bacterium]|nr:hypothetical protein [Fibromonadaceae bacterium]
MNSEKAGIEAEAKTEATAVAENSEVTEGTEKEDALTSMSSEDFKNMRLLAAEMGIKPEDTYKFEEMVNSLLKNGLISSQDLADAVKVSPQNSSWGWNVSAEDLEAAKAKESTPVRNVLEELWSMSKDEKKTETADLSSRFERVAKEKHFTPRFSPHAQIIHSQIFSHQLMPIKLVRLVPLNHPHCCRASFSSGVSFFTNAVNTNVRGTIYVPQAHYHHVDHFKVNFDLTSGKFAAWNSSGKKINEESPFFKVLADILESTRHKFAKHKHHSAHNDHHAQESSAELSQDMEQDEVLKKLFLLLQKLKNNEALPNEEAEFAEESSSSNAITA